MLVRVTHLAHVGINKRDAGLALLPALRVLERIGLVAVGSGWVVGGWGVNDVKVGRVV